MTTALASRKTFAVWFRDLDRWDVKFFLGRLESKWPAKKIGEFVRDHNEKVKPYLSPDKAFRILGVTNTDGVFFAYVAQGKAINQPYKRVNARDIAYNPYRINVGSIGLVPSELAGNYISPAYVVFSTDESRLNVDYLLLVMKSDWFNPTLRAATAGSVRQSLTYDLLCRLEIPLPPLPVQEAIVKHWWVAQEAIAKSRGKVAKLESEIPIEIYKALGTPRPKNETSMAKVLVLWWRELDRWSFNYLVRSRKGLLGFTKSRYPIHPLAKFLSGTINGYCVKPVLTPTPYRMLKLNALTPAGLDSGQAKFVKVSERIAERFHICKGDLLICRSVGSYAHVAKCVLVEEDRLDLLFPDIVIRVRFSKGILPEFVREVIQTPLGRSYFQSNARTAVGMWKIGAEDIRNFPIPVPPINAQGEIVDMVNQLRQKIAEERKTAEERQIQVAREVEEMIFGIRLVK